MVIARHTLVLMLVMLIMRQRSNFLPVMLLVVHWVMMWRWGRVMVLRLRVWLHYALLKKKHMWRYI